MAEYGSPDLQTLTLEAAADLRLFQYMAVRVSAANKCNVASDIGASTVIGVLQNKPNTGEFATVAVFGKSKMVAGGAITAGNLITLNSSGRAAAVASGGWTIGRALETSANDGEVITALIGLPFGRQGGAI
jgi:hypothetical protein